MNPVESAYKCSICGWPGMVMCRSVGRYHGSHYLSGMKAIEELQLTCVNCGKHWKVARRWSDDSIEITDYKSQIYTEKLFVDSFYRVRTTRYPIYDISVKQHYPDGTCDKVDAMVISANEIKFYGPEIHVGDEVEVTYKYNCETTIKTRVGRVCADNGDNIIGGVE